MSNTDIPGFVVLRSGAGVIGTKAKMWLYAGKVGPRALVSWWS